MPKATAAVPMLKEEATLAHTVTWWAKGSARIICRSVRSKSGGKNGRNLNASQLTCNDQQRSVGLGVEVNKR